MTNETWENVVAETLAMLEISPYTTEDPGEARRMIAMRITDLLNDAQRLIDMRTLMVDVLHNLGAPPDIKLGVSVDEMQRQFKERTDANTASPGR